MSFADLTFALAFPMLAVGGLTTHLIFRRLRLNHEPVWLRLDRPHLFLNNRALNASATRAFFWKRQYAALGDPTLTLLCRINLTCTVLAASLLLSTLALVLITGG